MAGVGVPPTVGRFCGPLRSTPPPYGACQARPPTYLGAMFGIEHRKGQSVVQHEVSAADDLDDVLFSAKARALTYGADNIRVMDAEGREIGIYRVEGRTEA